MMTITQPQYAAIVAALETIDFSDSPVDYDAIPWRELERHAEAPAKCDHETEATKRSPLPETVRQLAHIRSPFGCRCNQPSVDVSPTRA